MSDAITRLNAALEGRYAIERELGEGGMATVYLAEDIKHNRKVALKVLKPELAAVVGAERFLTEIKVTANLNHPHILPLHDSGEADGFLFYVMPYLEGESLRDRIDREKQLPVDEGRADRHGGGQRLGSCASSQGHPPGHQTREHPAPGRRAGRSGLRDRTGGRSSRGHPTHRDVTQLGHALLHEPGAGDG